MRDLIVIGGGPGGYVAAIRAAQLGMQVTLVEKDSLGGTCLNRGCIPTKAYYQNATVLQTMRQLDQFNVSGGSWSFDVSGAYSRKQEIVAGLVKGIAGLLAANRVEIVRGSAQIEGPHQVRVAGSSLEARRILIASGSTVARPAITGLDLPGVLTSDQLLELQSVPKRLAVVGGGVIGLEFASIFQAFGSQVTVVEYAPEVLGMVDREIAKRLRVYLKRQGISILTGTAVQSISETESAELMLAVRGSKDEFALVADRVLIATGRRPYTDGLGLERLAVQADARGFLLVDADYRTSVESIYAIGDVIGGKMLAHVASEEGRVAVERMAGLSGEVADYAVPSVVFTLPEVATVGTSEEDAKLRGIVYRVGKAQFSANSKAVAMGDTDGLIKVLADESGVLIGVHIIGPHAADLIQAATLMVKQRLRVADVATTIHPHPTLGEALLEAVLDVERRAIHLLPRQ